MTNEQLEIITGSLLGDGYLQKNKRAKNSIFKFKQCDKHSAYVEYMYEKLTPYVSCGIRTSVARKPSNIDGKISHLIEHWKGGYSVSKYFWSKSHPCFTELYDKWYKNNRKTVPPDLKITPVVLAHWYADDGYNAVSAKNYCKSICISTNSFTIDECETLASKLRDWNIVATINLNRNQPNIRVAAESYFRFIEIVSPHVKNFGCFDYKIDISQAPADRKGELWKGPKLDFEKAAEIRELRFKNKLSLKAIAKLYGVGIATVGKIVNNQMYIIKSDLRLGGTSTVSFKYGD